MYLNDPTIEEADIARQRVDAASREAFELALDCLHDRALQHALFQRMLRECEQEAA